MQRERNLYRGWQANTGPRARNSQNTNKLKTCTQHNVKLFNNLYSLHSIETIDKGLGSVKFTGNTISTARTLRKSNYFKTGGFRNSCFTTERFIPPHNPKKPSTASNKGEQDKRKFKYYYRRSMSDSVSSIQDPCFVNKKSKELPWVLLKSSEGFYIKSPRCETEEQRMYNKLVNQYKILKEEACGRVPSVNYTQLLHTIKDKLKELNNPELRSEMLRKRIKGNVDKYIWNIDKLIKSVDENHLMNKRLASGAQYMSGINIEDMNFEQIHNVIQKEIEENKKKEEEKKIKRKALQKNTVRASKLVLKFQEKVKSCLNIIKNELNISRPTEVLIDKPFARKHSYEFFAAVKSKDTILAMKYLESNPYLVYDVNCVLLHHNEIDVADRVTYSSEDK